MIDAIIELLKIVTPVVGAVWAAWLYIDAKREKNRADALNAVHQAETRRLESRRPFLELKLRLYVEATQLVGTLVAAEITSVEWLNAEKKFWSFYWSELSMVESEAVERTMISIGKSVKACRDSGDETKKTGLRNGSYKLAHQIRSEIELDWGAEPTLSIDGGKRLMAIDGPSK